MRRLTLTAALLLAGSACAPNPIVARDPVPAPGPQDAFACAAKPLPLNAFISECRPVPRAPVLTVKG